jgi:hypothetical protein
VVARRACLWSSFAGAVRRGCPRLSSEFPVRIISRENADHGVDSEPRGQLMSARLCEYRGAPATVRENRVHSVEPLSLPPAFVGSPKQGARPSARLCDGVGSAGRPRAPGRAPQTSSRGAQRTRQRRGRPAVLPRAKLRGGPPASPSFSNAASALQAKWGHGVGRHDRQMRGEIVRTRKTLRVRSRSLRVQTGLYRLLYRSRRPSFSF